MELLASLQCASTNSILIFASTVLFLWYCFEDKFSYWRRRNVPYVSLAKCILQFLHHTFGEKPFFQIFQEHYKELEGHKYGGSFLFAKPILILRDPTVIKEMLIKGFSSFHDRGPARDEQNDRLSGNLFQLTGARWRLLRSTMSPAFSSAKMKVMYETLKECSQELNSHLQKLCLDTGETELNMKELMTGYTMEVIGACALGIKCNAIQDAHSEFKRVANSIFKMDLRRTVYVLLELIHPKLPKRFRFKANNPEIERLLLSMCKETMELRATEKTSSRKDFLQILMKPQCSKAEETGRSGEPAGVAESSENIASTVFTPNVMAGAIGSFLSAGFEPVSSTLTFCFYHLAFNPEVQEKLWREIQSVRKEIGSDISYEDLTKFHYAEQVVRETLRMYPVAGVVRRNCTEPFKMPDSSLVVEKNVRLFVPTYSVQRDPKNFPEPNKFDPERFSEDNIDKIVPGSYLPFGLGPRSCIAQRLALMDVKTMVIKMVSNYTLYPCTKTQQQIVFDPIIFTLCPKGGVWLRIKKRK